MSARAPLNLLFLFLHILSLQECASLHACNLIDFFGASNTADDILMLSEEEEEESLHLFQPTQG